MAFETLQEYIQVWNKIEGAKPDNDVGFIPLFLEFLSDDDVEVVPDGEGAYFGKQCRVELAGYLPVHAPRFEVAFDHEKIVIYTGRNDGYWVAPYASLTPDMGTFGLVAELLKGKLVQYVGLDLL